MNVFDLDGVRVNRAVYLAMRLQTKAGHDVEAFRALRQIFLNQLEHLQSEAVYATTMAQLEVSISGRHWARTARAYAGSVFDVPGRKLLAVAAPVTLSLGGPVARANQLAQGDAEELVFLADRTQDVTSARRVIYSRQIFTLQELLELRPSTTRQFCIDLLEPGTQQPVLRTSSGRVPTMVGAAPGGPWELIYFVGACELHGNVPLIFDIARQAERLQAFSVHAKNAILSAPSLMFNRGVKRDGREHGVMLLSNATSRGEQALLVHAIFDFLVQLDLGNEPLRLSFVQTEPGRGFRLLADSGEMAMEAGFSARTGLSAGMFDEAARRAAALLGSDPVVEECAGPEAYFQMATRCGIQLAANAPEQI